MLYEQNLKYYIKAIENFGSASTNEAKLASIKEMLEYGTKVKKAIREEELVAANTQGLLITNDEEIFGSAPDSNHFLEPLPDQKIHLQGYDQIKTSYDKLPQNLKSAGEIVQEAITCREKACHCTPVLGAMKKTSFQEMTDPDYLGASHVVLDFITIPRAKGPFITDEQNSLAYRYTIANALVNHSELLLNCPRTDHFAYQTGQPSYQEKAIELYDLAINSFKEFSTFSMGNKTLPIWMNAKYNLISKVSGDEAAAASMAKDLQDPELESFANHFHYQ